MSATAELLPKLMGWFTGIMADEYATPTPRGRSGLLLGCPLWGATYIDRFRAYCLPSLMAPNNLEALQGSRLLFFTDTASKRLWSALRGVEASGIDVQVKIIPQHIMDCASKATANKFWIIGIVHAASLQMAGRAGMAFHMLFPDAIYNQDYFPNLLALAQKHPAIAQTSISANIATLAHEVEAYRATGGTLSIPGIDLGDLGWRHLHKQTQATLMNRANIPDAMPDMFCLAWQGRDRIVIHSCHMNAAYLSAERCAEVEPVIPAPMDTQLPELMGEDFHVPAIEDGLTFIEFSDDTKADRPQQVRLAQFAMRCWSTVMLRPVYLEYFKRPCEIPIYPQGTFMPDETIREQAQWVIGQLAGLRAETGIQYAQQLVARGLAERMRPA